MTSTNAYTIPIREYSFMTPVEDSKVIKLSDGTYSIASSEFQKAQQKAKVNRVPVKPIVVTNVDFESLSADRKAKIESKATRMGKTLSFPTAEYRNVLVGESKPAKLGDASVMKVNENARLCAQALAMKKEEIHSAPVAKKEPLMVEEKKNADVVVNFDPEEIKNRINASFDNARLTAELTPIKEYKIDISTDEEEEKTVRLPHADRSAKLDMSTEEKEDQIISLRDYIGRNSALSHETFADDNEDKMPIFTANDKLRGGYEESMDENNFLTDEYEESLNESIVDDGIEALMHEVAYEQQRAEEAALAAEQARKEKEEAAKQLEKVQALAKAKQEEREKARKEKEQVQKQREETKKAYEATLEATRKKLEAEKTRIMNRAKSYEKEYQRATEEANKLWSERVATEEKIDVIETEIPTIRTQTETDRETMASIRKRTKEIREMANDVAGVDADEKETTDSVSAVEKEYDTKSTSNNIASIFDGASRVDFSNSDKVVSFSKSRKVA